MDSLRLLLEETQDSEIRGNMDITTIYNKDKEDVDTSEEETVEVS